MDGLEVVRGLMARGYSAPQAAALAGHIAQESGFNPAAVNPKEGANGLLQWRNDRWDNLQKYAKDSGRSPTDSDTQLDFLRHEMTNGSEKKAGAAFLAAPDVASASAALKPFIRYGDNSGAARLGNANNLFTQIKGEAPVGALAPAAAAPVAIAAAPVGALAAAPEAAPAAAPTLAGGLGALGKTLQGAAPEFDPVQPLQAARPNTGQSQQIAAALAKAYGFGA